MRSGGARAGRARGVSAVRGGARGEGGRRRHLGRGAAAAVAATAAAAAAAGEAPRAVLRSPPDCAAPVPPPGAFLRPAPLCGRARAVAELLRVAAPGALAGGWGLQARGRGGG